MTPVAGERVPKAIGLVGAAAQPHPSLPRLLAPPPLVASALNKLKWAVASTKRVKRCKGSTNRRKIKGQRNRGNRPERF